MTHDIFLSYSSQDRSWAERLQRELETRSFDVFRDQTDIRAGEAWDPALETAIRESRHMVVLWSDKVAGDSWVHKEMARFDALTQDDEERKLIQIALKGSNKGYANRQIVSSLERSYGSKPENVESGLWERAVAQIEDGLADERPVIQLIVLACERAELEQVPDGKRPTPGAETFAQVLARFSLARPALLANYGRARTDWKPYGPPDDVRTILDRLRGTLIGEGAPPFRWQPVPAAFWASQDQALKLIDTVAEDEEPCLIVADLFSLYDDKVWFRFDYLMNVASNGSAAISLVTPLDTANRVALAEQLKLATHKLFRPAHFIPYRSGSMRAWSCSPMTADPWDLQRLLGQTLRAAAKTKHWATKMRPK